MIPHPIQCITILRIYDEILNAKKKGAIAEVKTGEGKSFIIAVIAIVLQKHGRIIDVVTSNLELAIRDEGDQKEYYELFRIKSGVLINSIHDKNFLTLVSSEINTDETKLSKNFGYNIEVFAYPIVYSTNYNFQFVYLHSLFNPTNLRQTSYDVVIVDEVDNMLLDQSSSPAIISQNVKYLYYRDILSIIYNCRDKTVDQINDILHYYFLKGIDITKEKIGLLLESALVAERRECDIDYVIKDNKVIIVDHTTGYIKPGSRWKNSIHEFIEIKEEKRVRDSSISTCSITQCTFFNMYRAITGLSGTLGSPKDQEILIESYGLNLFHIPRNLNSLIPIKKKKRIYNKLHQDLEYEIIQMISNKRPVLVIFNYIKRVRSFIQFLELSGSYYEIMQREGISTILGEEPAKDKKSILSAGKLGHVTIATAAAGRGMDIKLDKKSLESGGLHVILPFCMKNESVGRCGRQGQPGSCTQYISENDQYYDSKEFDQKYENLQRLQNKFADFLRNKWSWIYDNEESGCGVEIEIPYGCSIEKMIGTYAKKSMVIEPNNYPRLTGFKAWGMFYTEISESEDKYSSYQQMEDEYNNTFMRQLTTWISKDCTSIKEAFISINKEASKRIDWLEVILIGLDIAEVIASFGAREISIGIAVLKNGIFVLNQLLKGQPVDWLDVLIDTGLSILPLKGISNKIGLATKKLINSKVAKKLISGAKNLQFNQRILNSGSGKIIKGAKEILKGMGKDIVENRREYLRTIGDIISDISNGEVPFDKIFKMASKNVYNECSKVTLKYVKKHLEKRIPENFNVATEIMTNKIKLWTDFGREVLFDSVDIEKAGANYAYRSLKDPFTIYLKEKKNLKIHL